MATGAQYEILFDIQDNLSKDVERLERQLKQFERSAGKSVKQTERKLDRLAGGFRRVGKAAGSIGKKMSTFVTAPIVAAGVAGVRAAGKLEQYEVALTTMTGSAETAGRVLGQFTDMAARTPFKQNEIISAGRQLLAFGVSADKVAGTLRRIGDVSAGIGAPVGEIAEIFGKARVQGTLFAEDLNQLAGRGIPIFSELASVMGVNADQVKKLASEGEVGFAEMEEVFRRLTGEGGQFNNMMQAQSQTLNGKLSTAIDNVQLALVDLVEGFVPLIKDALDTITEWIERFNALDDSTKQVIVVVASLAAALGPLAVAIGAINVAMATLAANPVVAAILAAGVATAGIMALIRWLRKGKEDTGELADEMERAEQATAGAALEQERQLTVVQRRQELEAQVADSISEQTRAVEEQRKEQERLARLERQRQEAWSELQSAYFQTDAGQAELIAEDIAQFQRRLDRFGAYQETGRYPGGRENLDITNTRSASMVEAIVADLEEQLRNLTGTGEGGSGVRASRPPAFLDDLYGFPKDEIRKVIEESRDYLPEHERRRLKAEENIEALQGKMLFALEYGLTDVADTFQQEIQRLRERMEMESSPFGRAVLAGGDAVSGTDIGQLAAGGDPVTMIVSSLVSAAMEVENFAALLNFVQTIVSSLLDVIGPAMNTVLAPIVGVLRTIGTVLGELLLPMYQTMGPVLEIMGELLHSLIVPLLQILAVPLSLFVAQMEIGAPLLRALAVGIMYVASPIEWLGDAATWTADHIVAAGKWLARGVKEVVDFIKSVGTNPIRMGSYDGPGAFSSDAFDGLEERVRRIREAGSDAGDDFGFDGIGDDLGGDSFGGATYQAQTQNVNVTVQISGNWIVEGNNSGGGLETLALLIRDKFEQLELAGR